MVIAEGTPEEVAAVPEGPHRPVPEAAPCGASRRGAPAPGAPDAAEGARPTKSALHRRRPGRRPARRRRRSRGRTAANAGQCGRRPVRRRGIRRSRRPCGAPLWDSRPLVGRRVTVAGIGVARAGSAGWIGPVPGAGLAAAIPRRARRPRPTRPGDPALAGRRVALEPDASRTPTPAARRRVGAGTSRSAAARSPRRRQVVVTQPTEGEFKAFSAVCTHQGCRVGPSWRRHDQLPVPRQPVLDRRRLRPRRTARRPWATAGGEAITCRRRAEDHLEALRVAGARGRP